VKAIPVTVGILGPTPPRLPKLPKDMTGWWIVIKVYAKHYCCVD